MSADPCQAKLYIPVTTFGADYPLDELIQPFFPRLVPMALASFHYTAALEGLERERALPKTDLFIDSGGFSLLLNGAELVETEDGLGQIRREIELEDGAIRLEHTRPADVLARQKRWAQWGATLDFPIPPSLTDPLERERRIRLTLANALWAKQNLGASRLRLFGSVQGWDVDSYARCARDLVQIGFCDLAIGGLVPRATDIDFVCEIVRAVRQQMPQGGWLHAFGIGEPLRVKAVWESGADSVDSSSYVRAAASVQSWDGAPKIDAPSGLERAHLALANLSHALRAVSG